MRRMVGLYPVDLPLPQEMEYPVPGLRLPQRRVHLPEDALLLAHLTPVIDEMMRADAAGDILPVLSCLGDKGYCPGRGDMRDVQLSRKARLLGKPELVVDRGDLCPFRPGMTMGDRPAGFPEMMLHRRFLLAVDRKHSGIALLGQCLIERLLLFFPGNAEITHRMPGIQLHADGLGKCPGDVHRAADLLLVSGQADVHAVEYAGNSSLPGQGKPLNHNITR